ncbi:hypothetical protein ACFSJ3_16725 [Corallincola platygyrae]|uniref:MSHA biogenesis protein MshK n=1 Tax=Corallincola platygyrae TaxID=1193278 RepID=A0ABW4XRM6_9GAMM
MKRWILPLWILVALPLMAATPLKDPTRPPGRLTSTAGGSGQAGAATNLVLQQVIVNGSESLAIISGKQLRRGEKIRGYTVGKISTNQVELIRGEKRVQLTLFKSVKQTSK